MIPLLFAAALVDTVCVIDDFDWNTVVVHEWGVVSMSDRLVVGSVPCGSLFEFDDPYYLEDKAPVVTFYGGPFTDAVFTVTIHTGRFTDAFPFPAGATLDGEVLNWEIASARDFGESYEIPVSSLEESRSASGWAYDDWRDGPAHVLEFTDGTSDRFIYYECSIPFGPDDPFFPFDRSRGLHRDFEGEVLVFEPGSPEGMKIHLCGNDGIAASSDLMEPYSREAVLEVLCSWSDGRMKSCEIADMWDSWEEWVLDGQWRGDRLLVFEIPPAVMERVSTLELEMSEPMDVIIERFYLGMSPFSFTF